MINGFYASIYLLCRVVGMCLGEKKTLMVPPELGYGSKGAGGDIPGGATLRFTVELVGINDRMIGGAPHPDPNIFKEMDGNKDLRVSYDEMAHWFKTMHPDQLDSIPPQLWEREDKDGVSCSLFLVCFCIHVSTALSVT